MCYSLQENKTIFDKDIMEGVYCITCGLYASYPEPLCIVGGNCSVTGIDSNGEDIFWTVLGGNAICMILSDINGDGANELIVGTDDFSIRFYKNEDVINEINENTKIINIESLDNMKFVYALENGTIGMYLNSDKIWKRKEKGYVSSFVVDDFNGDNEYEILCGWSTGKIDIRTEKNGRVLYDIDISMKICKILYDDFNQSNKDQLIVITEKGEVIGYEYSNEKKGNQPKFIPKDKNVNLDDLSKYENLINAKQEYITKLEDLAIKDSNKAKVNSPKDEIVLPKTTHISIDLQSNNTDKCADLIIESAPEGTVIHSVILISEQIYKGETYVKYPSEETNKVVIQIKTKKDLNINLNIKVLVGKSYYLSDYQVFEFCKVIPKYCFYILLREEIAYKNDLVQGISFKFNERVDRLILWLKLFFNLGEKELESFRANENTYKIRFMSLRTDKVLQISVKDNVLYILTEEIELAGNILQDMCTYFNIPDMDTTINYTQVVKGFTTIIERIQILDKERNHYNINMTEIITFIKDLFVRAEDNRLLNNIDSFKDYFGKINVKNKELLDEFEKRTKTYQNLISDLKQINEIIQIFSNLKVGTFKNKLIDLCRKCIRKKDYQLLIKIISTGNE